MPFYLKFVLLLKAKHPENFLIHYLGLGGKMPETDMPKHQPYSKVYRLLVNGEDDLVGQIAYAIYKQQKIEKITRFTTANSRPPVENDLASFM